MKSVTSFFLVLSIVLCPIVSAGVTTANLEDDGNRTESWVTDDAARGSLSIITSCLLTMGLCVWTALHLNIPPVYEPIGRVWLRNIQWTTVGLLAPELVVYQAWRQWVAARTLKQMVNQFYTNENAELGMEEKVRSENTDDLNHVDGERNCDLLVTNNAPPTWRVEHGYYAVMGGFVFDSETAAACGIEPALPLTLTPRGVAILARCGLIPPITRKEIKDKSKADGMAKALVCLQAGYMCVQAVGRKVEGLPITLLEFNTLGHVVCAFFIYILWWHKPWTIYEPTTLRGPWVHSVCSYMWMSSKMSDTSRASDIPILRIFTKRNGIPELERAPFTKVTVTESAQGKTPTQQQAPSTAMIQPLPTISMLSPMANILSPLAETIQQRLSPRPIASARNGSPRSSDESSTAEENIKDEAQWHRWTLAQEAMQTFPIIGGRLRAEDGTSQPSKTPYLIEELVVPYASNWPSDSTMVSNLAGVVMGMALWFASMAYGAVHAAAWNDFFPTLLEQWMWRASSLYIVGSGLIWLSINFFAVASKRFDRYWEKTVGGRAGWFTYVVLGILCTICGVAYAFARIFIVVESWISLRDLPVGAYKTPFWEPYIPHF